MAELVTLCSGKGAPGVTSAALALAVEWPRPVLLVEADPSGGDLGWRCRGIDGKELTARPSLLDLAGDVRGTFDADAVLAKSAQLLACGVSLIQGVISPAQATGIGALWSQIAHAARTAQVDVIADVGRLTSAPRALVMEATQLVVLGQPTLEHLVHLRETIREINTHRDPSTPMTPVLVGTPRHARADCEDLDRVLADGQVHATTTRHLSWDPESLHRLEAGTQVEGKKAAKAPLVTSARELAEHLASEPGVSPGRAGRTAGLNAEPNAGANGQVTGLMTSRGAPRPAGRAPGSVRTGGTA